MKLFVAALLLAVAGFGLAFWADEAQATGNCQTGGSGAGPDPAPVASTCKGESGVGTTTGGTASGRCFFLTVRATAPSCTTGGIIGTANQAWELNPGECTTVYYHNVANGALPPATPNKVSLLAQVDDVATVVHTFVAPPTAAPATGTSYQFCATSDGNSGSPARSGTVYFGMQIVKDNGNGLPGNTNYDVRANGVGSQDTSNDNGFVRSRAYVDSITNDANGAGAAYGAAGDETITITSTITPAFGDANHEGRFNFILDEATLAVGQIGSTVDVDTEPLAQGFVVDSTFPLGNSPYIGGTTINQNSAFGLRYTVLASSGHGANIIRTSDTTAYNSVEFSVDSRIVFDSDGAGTFATADGQWVNKLNNGAGAIVPNFNRGETQYIEGYLFNARSEQLTRSMNLRSEDINAVICVSDALLTPTAGKYSTSYAIPTGGSCTTLASDPGSDRFLRATNTDQNKRSDLDHYVSRLYYVDAHTQASPDITPPTLVKDDFPTEDSTEDLEFFVRSDGMGGDDSDWLQGWCHVKGVRKDVEIDTSGSALDSDLFDSVGTIRKSDAGDTGSDGWSPRLNWHIASTPLGTWEYRCIVGFNGNSGTDEEPVIFGVEGNGTTVIEEIKEQGDPLKVFSVWDRADGLICSTISESYLDGTARTGNAMGTYVYAYHEENLVVDADNPTETQFGSYRHCFEPTDGGKWTILIRTLNETNVPIGTSNILVVDNMNEGLEVFATVLPLILFIAIIIWAEVQRIPDYAFLLYILAILTGGLLVIGLWSELEWARPILIGVVIFLGVRLFYVGRDAKED